MSHMRHLLVPQSLIWKFEFGVLVGPQGCLARGNPMSHSSVSFVEIFVGNLVEHGYYQG